MSPTDWQLEARAQTPPWQLVEQQAAPEAQAWPITAQVPPVTAWQVPPAQVWVQHAAPVEQRPPMSTQVVPEQIPPTH